MSKETAFLGAGTVLGNYWTKRRHFDHLIGKDNFASTFGKSFQMVVYLDSAIANGPHKVRQNIEADTRSTDYLISHLSDIKPELTVFITTCDMLPPDADENTPLITESEDPFVQNRIRLYTELNRQFGRVLNVHIPEFAIADADFCPLIDACVNPPKGTKKLPFLPNELHQFYQPERILGDVERCIPLGISNLIPAMPPLSTQEVVEALNPKLLKRLAEQPEGAAPTGSRRTSVHSFQWLDPQDGYLVTKEDQLALLKFYFAPDAF